ncbi:hypothetical protein FE782_13660 [Paenibacillus antri]|uniref:DUF2197 domain-containing protein n=1 Tax=Paenibacillus antri TaxID=2582848 RepID=A0A5R9GEE4_9BACL|nr:hypothetical protein [Paenibacillus antri]TLS51718.1 hypothetical protein FE782_13660 [Paenibacillus antri]
MNEDGFRLRSICYICKKEFVVFEGTAAYDRVKRNAKGMHCCEECKFMIELEARVQFGRRLLTGKD